MNNTNNSQKSNVEKNKVFKHRKIIYIIIRNKTKNKSRKEINKNEEFKGRTCTSR